MRSTPVHPRDRRLTNYDGRSKDAKSAAARLTKGHKRQPRVHGHTPSRSFATRASIFPVHDRERDALRHDHEKRVLEPEPVGFHLAPVNLFEKLRPKLAFQRYGGLDLQLLP
jgi:hypothetical protein